MSYIVCRNCKNYIEVDETIPLSFDKCQNCGHILEFVANENELNMVLNDIQMPKISYNKICLTCHSLNPRGTVACLHCGSTNLHFQYDMESFQDFQESSGIQTNIDLSQPEKTIILQASPNFSPKNSLIFRIFSLLIGLIDFFFFSLLGFQLIFGSTVLPTDVMTFATQNLTSLMLIISLSLILSGVMSVLIIPKMTYKDSLVTSSTIGVVIGFITLIASRDLVTLLVSIILCTILTGIGGLIGEFIIHRLTRH